jgi:hypothetical protein
MRPTLKLSAADCLPLGAGQGPDEEALALLLAGLLLVQLAGWLAWQLLVLLLHEPLLWKEVLRIRASGC